MPPMDLKMVGLNPGQLFEQMMDDWIYYLIKNPVFVVGHALQMSTFLRAETHQESTIQAI